MEGKYTEKRLVHSDAEIEARVWYSESKSEKFIQEEKQLTGNTETKYKIKINNFIINLDKSIPNFEKYDTINEDKKIKIFSNFYLPIQLEICNYQEVTVIQKQYSYNELRNKIIEEIKTELEQQLDENANVINIQINEKDIDNGIEIEMIYEVLENIGVSEKIQPENIINNKMQ